MDLDEVTSMVFPNGGVWIRKPFTFSCEMNHTRVCVRLYFAFVYSGFEVLWCSGMGFAMGGGVNSDSLELASYL